MHVNNLGNVKDLKKIFESFFSKGYLNNRNKKSDNIYYLFLDNQVAQESFYLVKQFLNKNLSRLFFCYVL